MLLISRPTGEKIGRPPNRPSILHMMFGWWSQHTRHKITTCSPQSRNIARNMYNMSGEEGGGATWKSVRNMEKLFATRCLDIGRNMFATKSQHRSQQVHYVREGGRGAQHRKSIRNMGKGVRNICNTLRNIMVRQLICFLIRIVWLGRCPMLASGSDVRALAVPFFFSFYFASRSHPGHAVTMVSLSLPARPR
jgi:hypothetical protein